VSLGMGTDDDVGIGFDDVVVPELFDELAADVRMAVVDVNFVLILLGSGGFVDEVLQLFVGKGVRHLIFKGRIAENEVINFNLSLDQVKTLINGIIFYFYKLKGLSMRFCFHNQP
jgi:hypothetical protein